MPFAATWMELDTLILSEVSQKKKDKYLNTTYMWNLKYGTNEPIHKTKTDIEKRGTVAKWSWGRLGIGISKCK